jgi:hypothetical protein
VPIEIPPSFKRKLAKKTPEQAGAILRCIAQLDENPRHPGLHTHRVQGAQGVWEAYVDDANRVTFHYEADRMVFRTHCNHDVLRRPLRDSGLPI